MGRWCAMSMLAAWDQLRGQGSPSHPHQCQGATWARQQPHTQHDACEEEGTAGQYSGVPKTQRSDWLPGKPFNAAHFQGEVFFTKCRDPFFSAASANQSLEGAIQLHDQSWFSYLPWVRTANASECRFESAIILPRLVCICLLCVFAPLP